MRILTSPINELAWQDVLDYCALALPEGIIRDYKQDIPSDLEKTVAAMANTSGGVILVGVAEDRKTTKPAELLGIPLVPGLHERILNICISNTTPILTPEIAVIASPAGDKAAIVIRVSQSPQAPHATSKNTKVYLRHGSVSNPEDYASLDELEWLQQGRQKSVAFREQLVSRANDRFWQFLKGFHETRVTQELEKDGMLQLTFAPTYPRDILRQPPELQKLLWDTRVRDYYGTDDYFPIGPVGGVLVQDGLVQQSSVNASEWVHHTEVNSFGLLFFKQSLLHPVTLDNKTIRLIRSTEVFARLDEMFDWAKSFYEAVGYVGAITFSMHLENLIGSPLGKYTASGAGIELAYCPDPTISLTETTSTNTFQNDKRRLILSAAQRLAWAYGWDLSSRLLEGYYTKYKRVAVLG